ncbi:hypothetical protein DMN91_002919 [Ooceraea biroi]|uniref:Fatty acid desaturase domain-containing protein n=2 Tax=Ooceraea biroi TaxID=2015173 RepID=A0A3L8DY09_OOCBI|nr:(11Z)-hexadec-11-enoyl-CoA conjugase [Ooceraea biroi]RLU24829.1 hypothetical protein DMN91_002919 [Ooceraea biroi]
MTSMSVGTSVTELEESLNSDKESNKLHQANYEWKIVWRNVIIFSYIHLASIYAAYLCLFRLKFISFLWFYCVGACAGLGVTAGAHRLWCHRCYKAKWPMRLMLMIFHTIAFQDAIFQWVRDHRVHHKFTDTDADPYNARQGFFFSHIGWLLVRKHPSVKIRGATVDCSDLEQDPFVVFQKKWYMYLMPFCCFIIPTLVPYWFWGESLWYSWHAAVFRYCVNLNITWSVNSAAHMWGVKPYNKSLSSTNNSSVSFFTLGEGWHNYHHVFPWDYKAAELGNYRLNLTTAFIDLFAYFGLAYDLKTVPVDMIKKRVLENSKKD